MLHLVVPYIWDLELIWHISCTNADNLHGELHDGVDNVVGIVLQRLHRLPSRDIGLGGKKLKRFRIGWLPCHLNLNEG